MKTPTSKRISGALTCNYSEIPDSPFNFSFGAQGWLTGIEVVVVLVSLFSYISSSLM